MLLLFVDDARIRFLEEEPHNSTSCQIDDDHEVGRGAVHIQLVVSNQPSVLDWSEGGLQMNLLMYLYISTWQTGPNANPDTQPAVP